MDLVKDVEERRALLDAQGAARDLADPQQHAVAVQLAERDRLQDQKVERAREQRRLIGHGLLLCRSGEPTPLILTMALFKRLNHQGEGRRGSP